MRMTPDELEYAISQYLDGALPLLERNALEERLADDAQARAILAEYQKLDTVLKGALPVPEIAWDRLSAQIQNSLEQVEAPVQNYSLRQTWMPRMAIAAAILLVASITLHFVNMAPTQPQGSAIVSGPRIEESSGPVIAEISIGHAPSLATDWRAAEEVVSRPTVVFIDRATPVQDNDSPLY